MVADEVGVAAADLDQLAEWDSLMLLQLWLVAEDLFQLEAPEDLLAGVQTLDEVHEALVGVAASAMLGADRG